MSKSAKLTKGFDRIFLVSFVLFLVRKNYSASQLAASLAQ